MPKIIQGIISSKNIQTFKIQISGNRGENP